MKVKQKTKALLAATLAFCLCLTACTDKWIQVALADLPIITQMAINIGSLASVVRNGPDADPNASVAITRLSDEAKAKLQLLQKLINEYQANPSEGVLQQIRNTIALISNNLPELLAAIHIKNGELAQRISIGVGIVLATVSSLGALLPGGGAVAAKAGPPPSPKELKARWNREVAAASTGNAALNAALTGAQIN